MSISLQSLSQVRYTGTNLGVGTSSPSSTLNVHGSTPNIEISNTAYTESGILFNHHAYQSTYNAKITYLPSTFDPSLNFYIRNVKLLKLRNYGSIREIQFADKVKFYTGGSTMYLYPVSSSQLFEIGFTTLPANKIYTRYLYRNAEYSLSDKRVKEKIHNLEGAIELINQLRPVNYDLNKKAYWRKENMKEVPKEHNKKMKNQYGFIAQEIQEILPQLVDEDTSANLLYMNYEGLIPILVKALQEQQEQIDKLSDNSKDNKSSKRESSAYDSIVESTDNQLFQNIPNPFDKSTEINYSIASDIQEAKIMILNLNGSLIKSIPLKETGNGTVEIKKGELSSGIYLYSLIGNGVELGTKRMIID